ncbi:MAG: alkaline phosphatase family protein [Pseudolabrys sp.]
MLRRCSCLVAVTSSAFLSLCASAPAQSTGAPVGKVPPKLVLFLVIDGFPQDQLVKYYDLYGDRGFKLLLDKGGWYGNSHYSHATTYTSVGHATLLSCAHPYKHGVVGNDWIDKKTGKRLYSTEDARFKYLDEETPEHSGTSPFNIKVTTVGDELIYANSKSKVIAIAGKDRSAIGLAGQRTAPRICTARQLVASSPPTIT